MAASESHDTDLRALARIPVVDARADSPMASPYDASSIWRTRGSAARATRSSSRASAILRSVDIDARDGSSKTSSTGAIPSGTANAPMSAGVANRALSRASLSTWSMTSGASEPADAKPTRAPSAPSKRTRTPTPDDDADVSDSTSPWYARISVSVPVDT